MTATTHAPAVDDHAKGHSHALPLMPFFLALLALTAAEVGLYEWWRSTAVRAPGVDTTYAIPKFVLVLLVLVFTLPKAYIVLVYFMHIRFEKAIIVWLAVIPLTMTFLAVLPTLTDTATLKSRKINRVESIGHYGGHGHEEIVIIEGDQGTNEKGKEKDKKKPAEDDDYK